MMKKRNSRKVYHFFFGSLEFKGYLIVYTIHKNYYITWWRRKWMKYLFNDGNTHYTQEHNT